MRDLDSAVGRLDNILMSVYVIVAALIVAVALVRIFDTSDRHSLGNINTSRKHNLPLWLQGLAPWFLVGPHTHFPAWQH